MRLYVNCKQDGQKIFLNLFAHTREEWRRKVGEYFLVECNCGYKGTYSVNDVFAEEGVSSVPAGAVLGGLIGLLAGPLGMILGGTLGTLLGATTDENEKMKVRKFNDS